MKPMGAIPAGFAGDRPLMIAGRDADSWIAQAGDTPLFVYEMGIICAKVARFRAAFRGIDLHYAVKANPFAPLLAAMAPMIDGFDIASGGELSRVADLRKAISFAGPGKR
ncbi:MAG: pyridoxal-dependent decarboxylase, exosortase A system-associated, partial [Pseudomonadota bacterium]|nr:pyridoxal-dependent decarboxylase, exosortase A system-associated [Pseudomonadota bacterium]